MPKFETSSHQTLYALCQSPELTGILHPYETLQGLLFAVCAAPEIPMPEEWLPWVIKTRNQLSSTEQADQITDVLVKLLQFHLQQMSNEHILLPRGITFTGRFEQTGSLSLWCQGMLMGHKQLEPVWHHAWNKMQVTEHNEMRQLQKDLAHCLYMFTTFADMPLAIEQAEARGNKQLADLLPKIFLSFSQSMKTYVGLSGRLVDFLPNQFETFEQTKH